MLSSCCCCDTVVSTAAYSTVIDGIYDTSCDTFSVVSGNSYTVVYTVGNGYSGYLIYSRSDTAYSNVTRVL